MHGFPLYPAMKQIVQSINQKLIDKKCNILYTAASNGSSQLHGKAAKLRWVAKGGLVPAPNIWNYKNRCKHTIKVCVNCS